MYHPPEGEECETSVEHGLPLRAGPAVGYCSRRPRPSPMWGSRFVGARAVGPWVGEQKPLGKSPLRGNPSPESTYLPTYLHEPVHTFTGLVIKKLKLHIISRPRKKSPNGGTYSTPHSVIIRGVLQQL